MRAEALRFLAHGTLLATAETKQPPPMGIERVRGVTHRQGLN